MHHYKKSTGKCYLGEHFQVVGSMRKTKDLANVTFDAVARGVIFSYLSCIQCNAHIIARYKLPPEMSLWLKYDPRHQFPTELQGDVAKEAKTYQL